MSFTNQCLQKRGDMGFNRDGGYGQYELIHENIFFPVPDELSATEATLLLDIMGTGGHAVERCQLMRPDIESLLVVGAGPIGLGVLAIAPERSIVGSEYFRYDELPANLRRLLKHRTYLNQIITHRMGIEEIQQAFEAFFFGGETGKVIIEQ